MIPSTMSRHEALEALREYALRGMVSETGDAAGREQALAEIDRLAAAVTAISDEMVELAAVEQHRLDLHDSMPWDQVTQDDRDEYLAQARLVLARALGTPASTVAS